MMCTLAVVVGLVVHMSGLSLCIMTTDIGRWRGGGGGGSI